jgi:hypothetical protein
VTVLFVLPRRSKNHLFALPGKSPRGTVKLRPCPVPESTYPPPRTFTFVPVHSADRVDVVFVLFVNVNVPTEDVVL